MSSKARVFFHPIEGSGPLSITWSRDPKGPAVEAKNELGVGFISSRGELLGVIFDDVNELADAQFLEFDRCRVDVKVKKARVSWRVTEKKKRNAA